MTDDDESFVPLYFAKVDRALACVAAHDPKRLARIRRDVRRILVSYREGCHYTHTFQMIVLRWDQIAALPSEEVASALVHEATHARHELRGIPYIEELRERIEASCVGEEIAFAKRLPHSAERVEDLGRSLGEPWWTSEDFVRRNLQTLEDVGAPRWIRRFAEWSAKQRLAREAHRKPPR